MSLVGDLAMLMQIADLSQQDIDRLYNNLNNLEDERNKVKSHISKTRRVNKNELVKLTKEIEEFNKTREKVYKKQGESELKMFGAFLIGTFLIVFGSIASIINLLVMAGMLSAGIISYLTCGGFAIKNHFQNKKIYEIDDKIKDLQTKRADLIQETNNIKIPESEVAFSQYNKIVDNVMKNDFKEDKFYVIEGGKSL